MSLVPTGDTATQHRSIVYTTKNKGMVASASPLANAAGLDVLIKGGNAFDAAIAVAAVQNVTMPMMCTLGGDVFAVVYEAKTGRTYGVNGSGVAPTGATREYFTGRGYNKMPEDGPLAPSVPGAVHAYDTILKRFGTWPLGKLLEYAVPFAEEGFPIPERTGRHFQDDLKLLRKYPTTAKVMTKNGEPYRIGEVLVQKYLARSFRRIIESGAEEFYTGALAKEMIAAYRENGGLFTEQDFAAHTTDVYEPLRTNYRGYDVLETAPPSQGLLVLEMLNLVEGYDLKAMGAGTPEAIHLLVEAKKLAYADRNRYMGDPKFVKAPLKGIISREYAAVRRRAINADRAAAEASAGDPHPFDGNTTYFAIVDGQGNAVSFIHSISNSYGCGFIAGDTGILFNNRAGRGFNLIEGHPNCIAPGKKTMHTLNAYMVMQGGKPFVLGGTPGGDSQPQWNLQIITNIIDFGMNVQQAIEAPRWMSHPGTDPVNIEDPFELQVESRFPREVLDALAAKGHKIKLCEPWFTSGGVQLIKIDPETGVRMGGSDPHTDGAAVAY